ncbi:hypothetical protein K438DRAFT_1818511, partial [Mycena galopus ATCC 62051]
MKLPWLCVWCLSAMEKYCPHHARSLGLSLLFRQTLRIPTREKITLNFARDGFPERAALPSPFRWKHPLQMTASNPYSRSLAGRASPAMAGVHISLGNNWSKLLRLPATGKFPFLEQLSFSVSLAELPVWFCDAPKLYGISLIQYCPKIQLLPSRVLVALSDNPTYKKDSVRIAFILSYMKEVLAAAWANNIVQANLKEPGINLYS